MKKYLIGVLVIAIALYAAALSGFFYGKRMGREHALKSAVEAFEVRGEIDHETANLDGVDLCIALGGLPDECGTIVRGLDEATKSKQAGTDGH